jgi:hypothetical protein
MPILIPVRYIWSLLLSTTRAVFKDVNRVSDRNLSNEDDTLIRNFIGLTAKNARLNHKQRILKNPSVLCMPGRSKYI